MSLLEQSAFLKALGWALLNSLWQYGLLWLAFLFITGTRKRLAAEIKHGLSLMFMLGGFLAFAVEFSYQYFAYSGSTSNGTPGYLLKDSVYPQFYAVIKNWVENNLPYLSLIYLLVVATLFIKFFSYFYYSHKIRTSGLLKIGGELRLHTEQLALQLGIARKIQVWLSNYIDTPMIIGFLKPTILIPVASMNQLSVKQLEAILLHELAHIKRNDYLVNLLVATTEILFFFNPFTRLFVNIIKQERENTCDDLVLQFHFDPHQYASALLTLERNRSARFSPAIAATGESKKLLLSRIQRIMKVSKPERINGFQFLAYVLTIGMFGFVALFNPGDLLVRKLSGHPDSQAKLGYILPAEKTKNRIIEKASVPSGKPVKVRSATPHVSVYKDLDEAQPANPELSPGYTVASTFNDVNHDLSQLIATVNTEERDFSIPDPETPVLSPVAPLEDLPFVPNSSFSYLFPQDTMKPAIKRESYRERVARESLTEAKKAMEKIDWNRIGKQLKNKVDVVQLKKQIQQALDQLNWQKINEEVTDSLNTATNEKMRAALKAEIDRMNQYKDQQKEFEKINTELQQKQEKYKRDAEVKFIQIQQQLAKKKIVVYI